MTYIMRKFHLLAYFDFRNQFDQKVPSKVDSKEWIKYYKKLINQVYKLKPVIIPHFRGLHDLTNHPVLGRYIKKLVLAQWIQKNVSLKGFIQLKSTTAPKMSKSAVKTLYKQLKTRLSYNYNPIVYLSKRSQKIFDEDSWIHVLNVFDISLNKDHFSISLWDTNSTNMKYVSKTVKIYSNGKISGDFSDLIGIHLYPEDDREIAQIVFNKSEWCTKSKKINRLCRGELDL